MVHLADDEIKMVLRVLEYYSPDCNVFAFGSRVKGTHSDTSDLDLVFDCGKMLEFKRLYEIKTAFELSDLKFRVDVIDYNTVDDEFREIINKDKELLFTQINA